MYSVWLTVGTIVWVWADEATKPLVQGRHFSWLDVGGNVLGIANFYRMTKAYG